MNLPEPSEVAAGVWAIPVEIPGGAPPFTLSYALLGDDGAVHLIDPGWDSVGNRGLLAASLRRVGLDLDAVATTISTHHHPDHIGLAEHLRERVGASVLLGAEEHAVLVHETRPGRRDPVEYAATLSAWGVPQDRRDELIENVVTSTSPIQYVKPDRELVDGELIDLGGHELRVVATPGHTDGHLCLVDERRRLIYTGDHVLPRINSGVGLGTLGERDILGDYFASLAKLAPYDDFLVLPGHERTFLGLGARRREIAAHHLRRSGQVAELMPSLGDAPVWEYARRLSWTAGWDGLRGFMLHSALMQTERQLRFARSGSV